MLADAVEPDQRAQRDGWPLGRGFERFYGFLGGETNQWYPDLVYDNHFVEPPATPEEGCHLSADLADKAIEFVRDAKAVAPEKPWLDFVRPWASLSEEERRLFARMAEVFAGFVPYTDAQIGRLIDYLEESGQLDDTIIRP